MARNLNHIGIGFCHSSRNGADPNFRHQFDADWGLGMHLVQIMNQLSQVFNGINIVMRRWRDQSHTRFAVAQPGDVVIDLRTRQLPAFTRFGTLGHLDL